MKGFYLDKFINKYVTERSESMFNPDIKQYVDQLKNRINGRSVLVIGGAGTIGSSFIKAILKFKIASLYVVDINENGLTELVRDLRSSTEYHIPDDFKTYPINFSDPVFKNILKDKGAFQIVANFAAHKHVRSEKDHFSIRAMIDNNVLKAKNLLDLLVAYPPERFFCVSTDKAANPVNVMGASKKLMEEVILAYSNIIPISTARFANVAFSNGSLPFGFLQRLMKRQPLAAPKDIKRYFVSPEESGQICLLACVLGNSGDILFPKLDEDQHMKTFTFIAEKLLNEQGYTPVFTASEQEAKLLAVNIGKWTTDYPVYFFDSDTSGEKPFEEFYTKDEEVDLDTFKQLGVIKNAPKKTIGEIQIGIDKLEVLLNNQNIDKAKIVHVLKSMIPNFDHIEKGKSLDQKM